MITSPCALLLAVSAAPWRMRVCGLMGRARFGWRGGDTTLAMPGLSAQATWPAASAGRSAWMLGGPPLPAHRAGRVA